MKKWILPLLIAAFLAAGSGIAEASTWIKIDLSSQKVYLYKNGRLISSAPISSGKKGRRTPTGTYSVTQKDKWHRSGYYGSYVSKSSGKVVRSNVDARRSSAPRGTTYRGASMFYFLRFNGAIGMHAGHLPGYPASHGCVRLPSSKAQTFFNYANVGTKVVVQH
jgi:lipoprotein-anchoring transpeptidase ErfK/SrfK